jgi:leucyl-tRNA synthetase
MEYNTMPGWAGSSWYFLRYMDPHNEEAFVSKEKADYWGQVDLYIGGAEHAVGHLLYSRFWTKFLCDRGFIAFDEPFKKMINQGMILGRSNFVYRVNDTNTFVSFDKRKEHKCSRLHVDINLVNNDVLDIEAFKNWREEFKDAEFILNENEEYLCGFEVEKMSKSKYNVQTPDDLVEKFGADTLRMYEMFLGPLEQFKPWDTKGINGVHNFLRKFWRLAHDNDNNFDIEQCEPNKEELKALHKCIKKVTEDIERHSFNTVVSTLMIAVNELNDLKSKNKTIISQLVVLISPYAPHFAEELWQKLGNTDSVTLAQWPQFDEKHLQEDAFTYPVSFNGKMRFTMDLSADLSKDDIEKAVLSFEKTIQYLEGKSPKRVIIVPKKIVNIVV